MTAMIAVGKSVWADDLSARFYGSSTFLFDDGKSQILIDGFFSRQAYNPLWGRFSPDLTQISEMVRNTGICPGATDDARIQEQCRNGKELKVIIPVHRHYDHALDAGVLALWSGTKIIADESIRAVVKASEKLSSGALGLRQWKTPNMQPPFLSDNANRRVLEDTGAFRVTLLRGQHIRFFGTVLANGTTDKKLSFPASLRAFRLGTSFNVLIEHDDRRLLIIPSAGNLEGLIEDPPENVSTLFLSIGGLDIHGYRATKRYWQKVLDAIDPKVVYLIHWDADTKPFDFEDPKFTPARKLIMRRLFRTIDKLKTPDVDVRRPPALKPFGPFDG
ncbi:hypothetical protein [uncultured Roseibium sp.]|uniref:MBL fold metallo-hydrolase n=1 Tax=uncultured Roseibium sp. TaxID=1936171 RepID=UPI002624457D|nr:hypothetical protein [uncultured Roseibium sp.]